ncbi:hypothetical protein QEG98_42065 (plasmid) [Myxococcus sp. MxC21-1]|uniref:hypothetical protein n=1 Tax=Myxococcus sp. MxC21-1 TaxID=3041439 RepID=UPI0029305913|nr:hypothetical protein [Myxococcus sp. MxC21-1]WNZ66207.1 hypothetical protein QEG98_42065 [Myxococcus sp. MxC21-1]
MTLPQHPQVAVHPYASRETADAIVDWRTSTLSRPAVDSATFGDALTFIGVEAGDFGYDVGRLLTPWRGHSSGSLIITNRQARPPLHSLSWIVEGPTSVLWRGAVYFDLSHYDARHRYPSWLLVSPLGPVRVDDPHEFGCWTWYSVDSLVTQYGLPVEIVRQLHVLHPSKRLQLYLNRRAAGASPEDASRDGATAEELRIAAAQLNPPSTLGERIRRAISNGIFRAALRVHSLADAVWRDPNW